MFGGFGILTSRYGPTIMSSLQKFDDDDDVEFIEDEEEIINEKAESEKSAKKKVSEGNL